MSQIKTKFIKDNAVTNAKLAQIPANSIKGNNTGSPANGSDLTISQVNTMLGDVLANGTVAMTANLNLGSNNITNLADPTTAQMAATKNYVDTITAALNPAAAVYAATAGSNIVGTYVNGASGVGATLTTTATGTFTVDGTTPPLNSRILIKDQSSGFQNGIYTITTLGTVGVQTVFTRATDYNTAADMNTAGLIPIINGTVNALSSWQQVATITTVGTDSLVFTEFTANPSLYLLKANNLSDVASASTSFNNISPMTTLGDTIYENATPTAARLPGNTTTTQQFLSQTGDGTISAAPVWSALVSGNIPNNAANTTGTASNITATTNNTLTSLTALTTANALTSATSLALSGSQISGGTFGAVNGSALTNLSAANLSGVLPVGVTGGSGLSIATTQLTGILQAAQFPALTGDITTTAGSFATTLATVNSNVGSFGSSTSIPSFTVNAKGLITAASGNVVVAPAGTLTGTTLNNTVVTSSLTSVGTISTGTWNGTTIAITNGGTGQTTAAAAYNALSPMTTTGDLEYESATNVASRLPIGSSGQVLTVNAGIPSWQTPSASVAAYSVVSKTTTYTATTSDQVILCSGSAFTITAYTAVGNTGKFLIIKKTDSSLTNIITIKGNGSETIDDSNTQTLNTQYEEATIVSDGANWQVIDHTIPSAWTNLGTTSITNISGTQGTKGTIVVDRVLGKRVGGKLSLKYEFNQSSTGTAGTLSGYKIGMPSGYVIDTTLVTASTVITVADTSTDVPRGAAAIGGSGWAVDSTNSGRGNTNVFVYDANNFSMIIFSNGSTFDNFGSANAFSLGAVSAWSFTVEVPISGWWA